MSDSEEPAQAELAMLRVGDKLRMARQAAGLSIADIAAKTRITTRHVEAIEKSDFAAIPSRTYVTGFARAYARAVELPEAEIASEIRAELNNSDAIERPAYEMYEPTDPARLPPKVLAWTLLAVAVLLASAYGVWRFIAVEPSEDLIAQQSADAEAGEAPAAVAAKGVAKAPTAAVPADAPVVLTGLQEVWIGFDDANGKTENWRTLDAGETYEVPVDYINKFTLRTSIPQALKITVGGRDIGAIGPADTLTKNVSLKPADLVARADGPQAAAPASTPAAKGQPQR